MARVWSHGRERWTLERSLEVRGGEIRRTVTLHEDGYILTRSWTRRAPDRSWGAHNGVEMFARIGLSREAADRARAYFAARGFSSAFTPATGAPARIEADEFRAEVTRKPEPPKPHELPGALPMAGDLFGGAS